MKTRALQEGSVVGFVAIGLLLVLLGGGLLYFVSHKDEPSVAVAPPEITLPGNDKNKNSEGTNKSKVKPKPETPRVGSSTDNNKEDTNTGNGAQPGDDTDTADSLETTNQDNEVTELSQTGPAETAIQVLGLGALTVAGLSFVRSRAAQR